MLDHKIIIEPVTSANVYIDFKKNQYISETNFLDWAENEAKTDAGIPEAKLRIKHRKLKKNTMGLYFGQNKMAIKKSIIKQKDHFDYLETIRHEIEHYRFEKNGSEKILRQKLKSQTKLTIKEIYRELDIRLKDLYLGRILEKEFNKTRRGTVKSKIFMLIKIIDESLAYWHEIRFVQKMVSHFLTYKKVPFFFEANPIVDDKRIKQVRTTHHEKLKLCKEKKRILESTLMSRNLVIEIIFSVFEKQKNPALYQFLRKIYERHEYVES